MDGFKNSKSKTLLLGPYSSLSLAEEVRNALLKDTNRLWLANSVRPITHSVSQYEEAIKESLQEQEYELEEAVEIAQIRVGELRRDMIGAPDAKSVKDVCEECLKRFR